MTRRQANRPVGSFRAGIANRYKFQNQSRREVSIMPKIYKCSKCSTAVEIVFEDCCIPTCCGAPMVLVEPKTEDFVKEKHVPYIEKQAGGVLVKVGKETAHPMVEDHYIVYIQICADGVIMRKYLKPGDAPEAFFKTDASKIVAVEYCNKHGLWKSNQRSRGRGTRPLKPLFLRFFIQRR